MTRGVAGPALLSAALFAAAAAVGAAAHRARPQEARAARGAPCLGAPNLIALNLLWLRADALVGRDRRGELPAVYGTLLRVEPRLPEAHEVAGFHMAYDLAGEARDEPERAAWVVRGMETLDEGVRRNPRARRLRRFRARALVDRAVRWPAVERALRRARGAAPLDEAVEDLRRMTAEDAGDALARWSLAEALVTRGLRALAAAPEGAPAPAAAADLEEAAEAQRALAAAAADAPAIRAALEDLARASAEGATVARGSDAAARRRYLAAPSPVTDAPARDANPK